MHVERTVTIDFVRGLFEEAGLDESDLPQVVVQFNKSVDNVHNVAAWFFQGFTDFRVVNSRLLWARHQAAKALAREGEQVKKPYVKEGYYVELRSGINETTEVFSSRVTAFIRSNPKQHNHPFRDIKKFFTLEEESVEEKKKSD